MANRKWVILSINEHSSPSCRSENTSREAGFAVGALKYLTDHPLTAVRGMPNAFFTPLTVVNGPKNTFWMPLTVVNGPKNAFWMPLTVVNGLKTPGSMPLTAVQDHNLAQPLPLSATLYLCAQTQKNNGLVYQFI